jgi:hypothetical protein
MASLNLKLTALASQVWDVVKVDNSGPEDKASRFPDLVVEHKELSDEHSSYDENSISQVDGGAVSTPQSPLSKGPTEEDISKLRGELDKNLEEEHTLLSSQMQLLLQMEKLDSAILAAESEERLSKIARQQAQAMRLRSSAGGRADDEVITIQIGS